MKKTVIFTVATIFLMGILSFSIAGTAYGREPRREKEEMTVRKQAAHVYQEEVRSFLEEKNILNSGIMVTWSVDEQQEVEYLVTIHNKAIERLSLMEKHKLLEDMEQLPFPENGNRRIHTFAE